MSCPFIYIHASITSIGHANLLLSLVYCVLYHNTKHILLYLQSFSVLVIYIWLFFLCHCIVLYNTFVHLITVWIDILLSYMIWSVLVLSLLLSSMTFSLFVIYLEVELPLSSISSIYHMLYILSLLPAYPPTTPTSSQPTIDTVVHICRAHKLNIIN